MIKYRRRPVEVEAFPVGGALRLAGKDWDALPWWIRQEFDEGDLFFGKTYVKLRNDAYQAGPNDWLLREDTGAVRVVTDYIFYRDYEEVPRG